MRKRYRRYHWGKLGSTNPRQDKRTGPCIIRYIRGVQRPVGGVELWLSAFGLGPGNITGTFGAVSIGALVSLIVPKSAWFRLIMTLLRFS